MAWGALATGARAATGSTGQGLSLMQESFSEITLAELPLVIFNLARGQGDYFQATRGGGHGDYRHIVLAPRRHHRGRRAHPARVPPRRPVAQPGPRLRRLPHRARRGGGRRSADRLRAGARPRTGRSTGHATGTRRTPGSSPRSGWPRPAPSRSASRPTCAPSPPSRPRWQPRPAPRPATSTTPRPSSSRSAARPASCGPWSADLRAAGVRVGYVRPITLWPFPTDVVAGGRRRAHGPWRFELCAGQMIDDVRLAVLGAGPGRRDRRHLDRRVRASASAGSSTWTRSASGSSPCTRAAPTPSCRRSRTTNEPSGRDEP